METELLIDYYLVPGAEWSLIKKGETVQIIGKTRDNSWYRCMALRDSKVKLDRTPFSFMIRSIVNPPTPGGGAGLGEGQAGITPEMIDAEYAQRNLEEGSFSLKESAPQVYDLIHVKGLLLVFGLPSLKIYHPVCVDIEDIAENYEYTVKINQTSLSCANCTTTTSI